MKTTLGLLILCNESKNKIFNILGTREKSLESFSFDLDIPKSISLGEDEV